MNEVVLARRLAGPIGPENRLAVGGIGLGIVVAEKFALAGIRRSIRRRRVQFEAGLVEVLSRLHHLRAEPERFVTWLGIRQPGRTIRRVEGVAVTRGGVDQDGDLRLGRTERKGPLVEPGQTQGHQDGEDFGPVVRPRPTMPSTIVKTPFSGSGFTRRNCAWK